MFNLYENIQSLCEEKGLTVSAMCNQAGISKSVMSNLRNGRTEFLNVKTAVKIAFALGVSVDDVMHGKYVDGEGPETIAISPEAHHIGVLFDRADEKDRLLTHSVLDKYEEAGVITSINAASNNPGGFIELDVYDEPAAAGLGNYLDAPQARREQFPSIIVPRGADFGIRVSGRSMEPMVADGSTVFVRQTMAVEPGRVGIFVLNGASFCKQLIVDKEKMQVRLRSLNPEYADIIVQPSDTLVTIGQVL